MLVDLPTGIEQGTASTLLCSKVAAAYRAGAEHAGRPIQPVRFIRRDQMVSEHDLPAVALGEKVVANDRSAHDHRLKDMFDRVDVTHLLAASCVGLDLIAAGVATE